MIAALPQCLLPISPNLCTMTCTADLGQEDRLLTSSKLRSDRESGRFILQWAVTTSGSQSKGSAASGATAKPFPGKIHHQHQHHHNRHHQHHHNKESQKRIRQPTFEQALELSQELLYSANLVQSLEVDLESDRERQKWYQLCDEVIDDGMVQFSNPAFGKTAAVKVAGSQQQQQQQQVLVTSARSLLESSRACRPLTRSVPELHSRRFQDMLAEEEDPEDEAVFIQSITALRAVHVLSTDGLKEPEKVHILEAAIKPLTIITTTKLSAAAAAAAPPPQVARPFSVVDARKRALTMSAKAESSSSSSSPSSPMSMHRNADGSVSSTSSSSPAALSPRQLVQNRRAFFEQILKSSQEVQRNGGGGNTSPTSPRRVVTMSSMTTSTSNILLPASPISVFSSWNAGAAPVIKASPSSTVADGVVDAGTQQQSPTVGTTTYRPTIMTGGTSSIYNKPSSPPSSAAGVTLSSPTTVRRPTQPNSPPSEPRRIPTPAIFNRIAHFEALASTPPTVLSPSAASPTTPTTSYGSVGLRSAALERTRRARQGEFPPSSGAAASNIESSSNTTTATTTTTIHVTTTTNTVDNPNSYQRNLTEPPMPTRSVAARALQLQQLGFDATKALGGGSGSGSASTAAVKVNTESSFSPIEPQSAIMESVQAYLAISSSASASTSAYAYAADDNSRPSAQDLIPRAHAAADTTTSTEANLALTPKIQKFSRPMKASRVAKMKT